MTSTNKQLGEFLRLKRESLSPKDLGLPVSKRRRTPGLRREEVAELAGISADWYMRLEQGRDSLPSKMTADALAKVLKLTPAERSHLLRLSRGSSSRVFKKESVPNDVVKLVQKLPTPAYVIGARFDILCFNSVLDEAFPELTKGTSSLEKNILYKIFMTPDARTYFINWDKEARDMLEGFRISYDLWAHAPEFIELVEKLKSISPEFRKWWKSHGVLPKVSGEKEIQHEKWGKMKLSYSLFQLVGLPDLKLVLYSPLPERG